MITIKFSDDIKHKYNSFNEILNLDNYNKITYLDCDDNNLTSLPELPESLMDMNCSFNNLTSLPKLPKSLKWLSCHHNNLTSLPELSKSLEYLYCSFNKLTSLPKLPKSGLVWSAKNLTSVLVYQKSLIEFSCTSNKLTSLPKLPKSLKYFLCDNNNLSKQLIRRSQETLKKYIVRCNEFYYATKIQNFFKNVVLAQKRSIQILLAKSVENFYYSPDCKVMMKIREKQWQKHFK